MRTAQDIVRAEVLCCMSSLVSTLAQGNGFVANAIEAFRGRELPDLCEQAFELACPIPDYEEAAREAGWKPVGTHWVRPATDVDQLTAVDSIVIDEDPADYTAEMLCGDEGIEPYDLEVFEHWAVTDWLADKLIAHGEKVDKDFAGLCVWARTTTGQVIYADGVMELIAADLGKAG